MTQCKITYLPGAFGDPVINFLRNPEALLRIDGLERRRTMVPLAGVGDDGIVAEHPLACKVGSNSVKKFLFRAAVSDKISPRNLGSRLLVGRGNSSYLRDGVVVALECGVRRGSVLFLLRTVTLSEVMPSVVKVRSSVSDPFNVG